MVASMCSSLATLAWNLAVAFRAVAGRMLYTCSTPALLPRSSPCIPRLAWLQELSTLQRAAHNSAFVAEAASPWEPSDGVTTPPPWRPRRQLCSVPTKQAARRCPLSP